MGEQNRVTPYGEIVALDQRGAWIGNRGCIHRDRRIVRGWANPHWLLCALSYKGWVAPKWVPKRWTALFFYDEALAFAAGHRPCALCRRAAYVNYGACAELRSAADIDAVLHAQRLDGRSKRLHAIPWRELPDGTYVDVSGEPFVVVSDEMWHWSARLGYDRSALRPRSGTARVLTPPLSVRALRNGYPAQRNALLM